MLPSEHDTIVALSSAPADRTDALSGCGRAIVRLSGPDAARLAETVIRSRPSLSSFQEGARSKPGWRVVRGEIHAYGASLKARAYVMPGPRSYTRQTVVEIHIPAVRPLVLHAMETLVQAGARPALPGEFTRRALLNGRISLAQAEAIGALIRATSADEARAHAARLSDRSHKPEEAFAADLNDLLSLVELGLDFSQEDVEVLSRGEILQRVRALLARAQSALEAASGGDGLLLGDEPRAILIGPTNAGKSRLFNALLRREAAIVSAVQHTTRDAVQGQLDAEGVMLIDTAGLADVASEENPSLLDLALNASTQALRSADILLVAIDGSQPPGHAEQDCADLARALDRLTGHHKPWASALLWTKADLPGHAPEAGATACLSAKLGATGSETLPIFRVSSVSGEGIDRLRAFLGAASRDLKARVAAARASGRSAVRQAQQRSAEALTRAEHVLSQGLGEDAAVVELREAAHALAQTEGVLLRHDALTETLLDRIFARFCIGK